MSDCFFRVPLILSRKMQGLPTQKVIMEHEKRALVVKRATAAAFLPLYTDKNLHMTFNRSHPKVKDGMGCGLSTSNVKGHPCADNCRGGIRSYIINHQIPIELLDRSHIMHIILPRHSAAALSRCNVSVLANFHAVPSAARLMSRRSQFFN